MLTNENFHSLSSQEEKLFFFFFVLSIVSPKPGTEDSVQLLRHESGFSGWSDVPPCQGGELQGRERKEDEQPDPSLEFSQLFLAGPFLTGCSNTQMILMDLSPMGFTPFSVWLTLHPAVKSIAIFILCQAKVLPASFHSCTQQILLG